MISTRHVFASAAALVSLAAPALAAAEVTEAPSLARVIFMEDPAREATVSWLTAREGAAHALYLDTESGGGADGWDISADQITTGALGGDDDPFFHHSMVTGLEPGTRYYFVVETDGQRSEERWFVTAPGPGESVTFLYGGDSRSDWPQRRIMNGVMRDLLTEDDSILALVHGGDFIDDGTSLDEWIAWLTDHELTTREDGRVLPIIPTRGNHERDGILFDKIFGFPGGEGARVNYFTCTLSDHTKMLVLDSQTSVFGDQRVWLERELAAHRESTWLLAGYHTPAYPAVKIPGPARPAWVPLFDQYLVDVVFENDGHALKRTVPILHDEENPDGVVYVGEGGLGVKQRVPNATAWYLQGNGMAASAHHVQRVTLTPTTFTYEAIGEDGELIDSWSRAPRTSRGEIGNFELYEIYAKTSTQFEIGFTYGVDAEVAKTEGVFTLDSGLSVEAVFPLQDPRRVRINTSVMPPGATITLTMTGLVDVLGRELPTQTVTFNARGEAPEPDMGGPEDEPDMGGPEGEPDMGTPDEPSPPTNEGESDDSGCASAGAAGSAGGGGLVALALWWMTGLRRRREE